jgi:DNA mismatch repair protein MutL
MPAIRILSDHVANQIAAGEVIERPVAIVKELIENSLDSEATRIEIEFRNGGKNFIRVEDNGHGMSPDNALLALERHGTSKISDVSDLLKVQTFGFRGEALPSIASVSHFSMRTRDRDWDCGTEIIYNGGKFKHQKEIGIPVGTSIEVVNLFNSVPARRKFLKTDNTEAAHIIHLSRLYAVAYPNTSFTLLENGKIIFRSPVCRDLSERVREIFGKQIADLLIEINAENDDFSLTGLIGKPGAGRSTRQDMITYVNRRPVESRTLYYALIEAYHTYLPKGRYPLAFIFLKMKPQGYDINVHPAKREIKFRDEGRVRQFIMVNLLDRLREATRTTVESSKPNHKLNSKPALIPPDNSSTKASVNRTETLKQTPGSEKRRQLNWRYLGLIHEIFALYETNTGLVLLNTRAARERIVFERIQMQLSANESMTQKLLFPITLELDPVLSSALENNLDFFHESGFAIELFGRNFFRVDTLPEWLDPGSGEEFIRDLVARIQERGLRPDKPDLANEEIARLASAQIGRSSPTETESEMYLLAQKLLSCKNPLNDPRGRPTYYEISRADLDKKFFR